MRLTPLTHALRDTRAASTTTLALAAALALLTATAPTTTLAQGTAADYQRAATVRDRIAGLTNDSIGWYSWPSPTSIAYSKTTPGGHTFVLANFNTKTKAPAFDHQRLAAALSTATGNSYTAVTLPFTGFTFLDNNRSIEISPIINGKSQTYYCDIVSYSCSTESTEAQRNRPSFDVNGRGMPNLYGGGLYGSDGGRNMTPQPRYAPGSDRAAIVRDYNIWLAPVINTPNGPSVDASKAEQLSFDGTPANAYDSRSVSWSPDGRTIAAYRIIRGYAREIHYVQSSPPDQLQPKPVTRFYSKPGDDLDKAQPVLIDVATKRAIQINNELFPNAYTMSQMVWRRDSRAVHFEYNQRGHQVFRVIEIDRENGNARAVVNEEAKTFFTYSSKKYRYDVDDGREVVWMSERDGWNHIYLIDGTTGNVKNQITKGNWVVRSVNLVDPAKRQILFRASGMNPDQDPYFIHYYRINFDGTGLTRFTSENGTHNVAWSPNREYYLDTWSRIDMPPVSVIKRASDQSVVLELEKSNASLHTAAGFSAPEPFVAKARDDSTDIYGIIVRPSNFNPKRKYPVIEYIYAGPHDSFVPKSWGIPAGMQAQAELGFIVVQIDGMGTSNRSKAFHDYAWQNLADAGFPDRIKWHKAVAAKYPWYDATRVGIYGGSAGGQNSTGALLFHPEFYKVAVSFAGCHDNRMDKIWWNEQWMGWPVGPQYARSSNVDNAYRLQGKLLLLVGEMDENVDPASTFQVANALIKANKSFDLFVFPNGDHGVGRRGALAPYGDRKQWDYFVHHLLGVEPPNWNVATAAGDASKTSGGDLSGNSYMDLMGESWSDIFTRWGN